ncbi:heavy metal translocating P-type ATPase [Halobium salinum]|uniref:P-type Cu(+) transporter n=1 Tax=Halobium salinum TaxID=1364940 RepID=A0ABD5PBT7_9EURY|nr:heavy metal translocating P-type ATPase [Halobium salinum]
MTAGDDCGCCDDGVEEVPSAGHDPVAESTDDACCESESTSDACCADDYRTERDQAHGDGPQQETGCCATEQDHAHDDAEGHAHSAEDRTPDDGGETLTLSVPEMDCPSCAGKVENALAGVDGVDSVDPRPTSGTLRVTYDPGAVTADEIADRVEGAGYAVKRDEEATLSVPEMDCPSCAGKVENALRDRDGVLGVDTRPTSGTVVVRYDPGRTDRGSLVAAVEGAGYPVEADDGEPGGSPHDVWTSTRGLRTWAGAAFLLVGIVVEFALTSLDVTLAAAFGRELTVAWGAYLGAVLVAGVPILRAGYYSLRNRNLDIDLLMSIGIVSAVAVDLPFEAATLSVLFSVAALLERFSMDRARNSLEELAALSPDTATVLRDGEEHTVPAAEVAVGDRVVVRPGDRIPVDGVVREGESAVDESPVTGESVPADKTAGDEVYAGSVVEGGYFEFEATATADESTLQRVIELVEDAQANRSDYEQFVDRFARWYTPLVVTVAVATFLATPFVFGIGWEAAFTRALTLLVVACPCALVISTPVSVVSAVTAAARNGVLVKGGDRLEAMGAVDAVAFDKTGTLTTGELSVTDVVALNGTDETELLGCAAALERRSEHPIAAAVVAHADDHGVPDRETADFEALTGQGVSATLDGVTHYAGKPGLFEDLGFDLEHAHVRTDGGVRTKGGELLADAADCEHDEGTYLDLVNETVPRLQSEGKTVVLVGTEDELEGVVAVADTVRPEAAWAVSRLRELGVEHVAMLTGDNERTARTIGEQVGVDEVRADLLPEEKVDAVEELRERYGHVAMVGDGVNDAPALATADVAVAMGAAGTDTALDTADVALMGDDLTRVPYLYDLSSRATSVIRQNVYAALAVKAVLAVAAPFGLVDVIVAIVIGDMGASLGVTSNALRLAGVSPAEPDGVASPEPDGEVAAAAD